MPWSQTTPGEQLKIQQVAKGKGDGTLPVEVEINTGSPLHSS